MGTNDAKANKNTNPRYILAGMLKETSVKCVLMSLGREAFFSFPSEFVSVHWLASSIVEWSLNVHPESAAALPPPGGVKW